MWILRAPSIRTGVVRGALLLVAAIVLPFCVQLLVDWLLPAWPWLGRLLPAVTAAVGMCIWYAAGGQGRRRRVIRKMRIHVSETELTQTPLARPISPSRNRDGDGGADVGTRQ